MYLPPGRIRRATTVRLAAFVFAFVSATTAAVAVLPPASASAPAVPVPANQPAITAVGPGDGGPIPPGEAPPPTTGAPPLTSAPSTLAPVSAGSTVPTREPIPTSPPPAPATATTVLPATAATTPIPTTAIPTTAIPTTAVPTTAIATTTVPATPSALRVALASALSGSTSAEPSAFVVMDGIGPVLEVQPDAARLPASTQKIYTVGTALLQLGLEYRFTTEIRADGPVDTAGTLTGDLVVVAGGDPSLHTSDLRRLASDVFAAGVRTVNGSLTLDDSRFDAVRVNPGWKPAFTPGEVGSLSAFVVDGNHGRDQVGDPGLANLTRFAAALRSAGVKVVGAPRRGTSGSRGVVLAAHRSDAISEVAKRVGKDSDNTYAEVLLKELAADTPPGSTAGGVAAIAGRARALGVPSPLAQYDGSGLSSLDRTTTRAEVAWMTAIDRSSVGAAFRATLALSCVDGTMRSRLCGITQRRVVAKTGTLDGVTGLTGFLTTASGRKVTFSFLLNQVGSVAKGRAAIDQAVTLLTSYAG